MARSPEPYEEPVEGRGRYEEATWEPDFTRSGRGAGGQRYRAFIPNAIAHEDPTLEAQTFALAERAGAAVRELNTSSTALVPLEGLARQLLRSEALASSNIEGLNLSHRKLARAAVEEEGNYRALEVLANLRAMEAAVAIGAKEEDLTIKDVTAIHTALAIVPPLDRIAGQLRKEQSWIGGTAPPNADYVGPPEKYVRPLTKDLCEFMNRDDVPPVVQAAIAHAQFETIHPFGDGNGRVGRCLIHLLLRRRELAPSYVPPVSLALGANKNAYIAGLDAFREGGTDEWVAHFARAVESASLHAETFSTQVAELQDEWLERAGQPRADASSRRIVENLPSFPFVTAKIVQELTGRSNVAALRALGELEEAGILSRHLNKRKGDSWEAKELFALLEQFEQAVRTS